MHTNYTTHMYIHKLHNVKHILVDSEDITVGAVVMAQINSRKYKGTVQDLLEWSNSDPVELQPEKSSNRWCRDLQAKLLRDQAMKIRKCCMSFQQLV